ncbi:MAG: hypothetical protein IPO90_07905 [Flavobacteriales bacterium]|nr:hypothetical protein [Flavobacteriales bacterium]
MDTLPPDAPALLNEARTSHDFTFDYADRLSSWGDRPIDCAQYRFEISDGRDMLLNFEDASFTDFSIVEREPEVPQEESEMFFEADEPDPIK